ncbi:uncharacterized protein [Mytilus edulis]|uniref:uncharacterized protein n=1 Tax=Mytilus edulis TaxID=6550 RepID=UPI0039EF2D04
MRLKRKWQELRCKINKEIELAHNNYVNNLIGDLKQDSKPFWKYIKNQKADKQGIPPLKTHDKKTADTDQQKAEALNTQFTSVYTETEYESIPYKTPPVDKIINIIVTTKGVEKILKNINASKAMSPDGIHPRVLKELAPNISEVMAHFFQQCINRGTIPDEWKIANICPLFKKNDRTIPSTDQFH